MSIERFGIPKGGGLPFAKAAGADGWLYVSGQPMTLARWPNATASDAGWAGFSKAVDTGLAQPEAADPALRKAHGGSFVFEDPRPELVVFPARVTRV